jgi:rhamnosyl/mannosyltransferase
MEKTILHISKYYYPDLGGIETVAMYLAEGMTAYRNIVVCFATDGIYSEEDIHGVRVYRVPVNFSFMSQDVAFSYRRILRQLLRQYQPDAVHVHCPNPFVYPLVCSCVSKDTKVVLHWHSDILSKGLMYFLVKPFETAILHRADLIVSTSPQYIPNSHPLQRFINKVRIAQNGLITERFNLQEGDEEKIRKIRERYNGKKIIFNCGRHIPYKGLDNLIKADSFIKGDCVILIGGKGPIDKELKAIPCSNRVHFLGRLLDDTLRQYLYAADIFAFPSNTKAEAFGIALAEGMYCHCAPISCDIPGSGVNWVSIHQETGLVVPRNNVKALASAIDELIADDNLRSRYAEAAHKHIVENFTKEKAVAVMNGIYSELLPDN